MCEKRKREIMEKLDSCYKVVQQSSAKGISAVEIAKQLKVHRTTVHSYLNTLELMGKVYNEKGQWHPKEQGSILKEKDEEFEITIELPLKEKYAYFVASLENMIEKHPQSRTYKKHLNALKETRIIRIRGKNKDNIKQEIEKIVSEKIPETLREMKNRS